MKREVIVGILDGELTKEERIRYVPEILVANLENIELTFFEA